MKLKTIYSLPSKLGEFTSTFHAIYLASSTIKKVCHLISALTEGAIIFLLCQGFFIAYLPESYQAFFNPIAAFCAVVGALIIEVGIGGLLPAIVDSLFNRQFFRNPVTGVLALIVVTPFIIASLFLSIKGAYFLGIKSLESDKPEQQTRAALITANSDLLNKSTADYEKELLRLEGIHNATIETIQSKYESKQQTALDKAKDYDSKFRNGHEWAKESARVQRAKISTYNEEQANEIETENNTYRGQTDTLAINYQKEQKELKNDINVVVSAAITAQDKELTAFEAKENGVTWLFALLAKLSVLCVVLTTIFNACYRQGAGIHRQVVALRFGVFHEYYLAAKEWLKKKLRLSKIPDLFGGDRVQAPQLQTVATYQENNTHFANNWGAVVTAQHSTKEEQLTPKPKEKQQQHRRIGFQQAKNVCKQQKEATTHNNSSIQKIGNKWVVIHNNKPYTATQVSGMITTYKGRVRKSKKVDTIANNRQWLTYWQEKQQELRAAKKKA